MNDKKLFGGSHSWGPVAALLLVTASTGALAHDRDHRDRKEPIVLEKSGGFVIGGKIAVNPSNANRSLSCDHGYVEYFLPVDPRKTSLVMWHSSSTQVWQNRWDGGEGYKDMFLRRGYPVYLWDGPAVGRANWGCAPYTYTPLTSIDQSNFSAWKLGPAAPVGLVPLPSEWYLGVQFPTTNEQAWLDATRSRYLEFDRGDNIALQTDAAAVAADSGRLGDQIVYLTNSAGGLRAAITTSKATKNNIAGIVTYESIGYAFPLTTSGPAASLPMPATLCNLSGAACAFGPVGIPEEDFKKLAKLKKIQFVWGDNRPETESQVIQSRQCAALINAYGGNAEVLKLAEDAGLTGSTHIPFADMDNDKVAGLLFKLLKKNRLDGYASNHDDDDHHGHHGH
jgi:hypothetical protein